MKKNVLLIFLFTSLFLFIFAETNYLRNKHLLLMEYSIWSWVFASISVSLFVFFFPFKTKGTLLSITSMIFKVLLIFGTVFIVFLEAAIVDFSGILFGPEVIYHFNWDAFVLGVKEYRFQLLLLISVIAIYVYLVIKNTKQLSFKVSLISLIFSVILMTLLFEFTIYGRYYNGFTKYNNLKNVKQVVHDEINELKFLGINTLPVEKHDIKVLKKSNKNIVTIYLESFSDIFVSNPKYPNLTPNLDQLSQRFHRISPYISTGHFTMDGLISSHCGFIPNMIMGNNTMATGERFYYNVPCFTDVLKKAGYHQEFLGGAKKSFAGKGDFLLDHGYHKVWGREDFKDEFEHEMTWWGLHDDELFNKAKELLSSLQNLEKPFHLSILTLGTHLKGYPSPSCPIYAGSDDKFIQAIHCTDFLIGSLVNFLEQNAFLNDTDIVITGDHTVFNTSYTQELFGSEVDSKNLFGLIVSKSKINQKSPMGLYDIGPTILNMLGVEHNVSFILGDNLGGELDRKLFTRNELFIAGTKVELNQDCDFDLNKKIIQKEYIDLCDHRAIINKLYGYTENFKTQTGIEFSLNSEIKINYDDNLLKISDIAFSEKNVKYEFRKSGFIIDPESFYRKGIFVVKLNHQTNKAEQFLFFNEYDSLNTFVDNQKKVSSISIVYFAIDLEESKQMLKHLTKKLQDVICHESLACVFTNEKSVNANIEYTENVISINF